MISTSTMMFKSLVPVPANGPMGSNHKVIVEGKINYLVAKLGYHTHYEPRHPRSRVHNV